MPFAEDFRRVVAPRLRSACKLAALRIVLEETTFGEAHGRIVADGYRLGAAFLPDDWRHALHGQVTDWLIEDIEAAQLAWEDAQARAERASQDFARYEQRRWRDVSP